VVTNPNFWKILKNVIYTECFSRNGHTINHKTATKLIHSKFKIYIFLDVNDEKNHTENQYLNHNKFEFLQVRHLEYGYDFLKAVYQI